MVSGGFALCLEIIDEPPWKRHQNFAKLKLYFTSVSFNPTLVTLQ